MHLGYKPSKYKDTVYKSYFIAKSYREDNKVLKQIIMKIGKLSDKQASQIKLICKIVSNPSKIITTLENIKTEACKQFLDLAISNSLWEEWKLSHVFQAHSTNSELNTGIIAKILTLNRCTDPCSHYSIPEWVKNTALPEIMNHSLEKLNDDKIYYELDKIQENQENLENHLFKMTYNKDKESYNFINYDLSSSYFVGMKCKLSAYGKSKDDKSKNKQVLLGILVNDKGYPFKWEVYPGNTPEVDTLISHVDACKNRFKLKKITMVFDRGIVSDENLKYITDKKLKYISAMDKPQIPNIEGIERSIFKNITLLNFKENLLEQKFCYYDDALYFKDLGILKGRRYVLGFNPVLFEEEKKCRNEKIVFFENFISGKNKELMQADRSRNHKSTEQAIINELKRLKIKKYFENPNLQEIKIEKTNKKGKKRIINSFQITIEKKQAKIEESDNLDGVCVFVSNHSEYNPDKKSFIFSPEKIIKAYRDKTKIEDAFKHIKSFIKLRPFHVNTDQHVRAVYSICVLSYFLNKDLAERRKIAEGIDYLNSHNLYEPFRNCSYVTIRDKTTNIKKSEVVELTNEQKLLLKNLNLKIRMPQNYV